MKEEIFLSAEDEDSASVTKAKCLLLLSRDSALVDQIYPVVKDLPGGYMLRIAYSPGEFKSSFDEYQEDVHAVLLDSLSMDEKEVGVVAKHLAAHTSQVVICIAKKAATVEKYAKSVGLHNPHMGLPRAFYRRAAYETMRDAVEKHIALSAPPEPPESEEEEVAPPPAKKASPKPAPTKKARAKPAPAQSKPEPKPAPKPAPAKKARPKPAAKSKVAPPPRACR